MLLVSREVGSPQERWSKSTAQRTQQRQGIVNLMLSFKADVNTFFRFAINIQTGPNLSPRDDIVLHISAIFAENAISRASYQSGVWGPEERTPSMPFIRSQPFDIIIMCDADCFKVRTTLLKARSLFFL